MDSLRFILCVLISYSVHAFPQEEQTEISPTESQTVAFDGYKEDVEDDLPLQDMMDRYVDIPHLKGDLNCQCGMPVSRITGGEDADINQYPWTVLLYAVESESLRIPYCGGALVNNLYVLTAAHCIDGMNPKMVEVVLREQNLTTTTDQDEIIIGRAALRAIRIEVDRFIPHPNYSRRTLDNDIGLIKLKLRVPLIDFPLAPICVPNQEASFSQGMYATVAGYGAISESQKHATNLQMAEVRVLSNELCNSMQFHHGKITENMLCADGDGKGPCAGDTGGPLMIRTSTGRQVLAGLASWSTTCKDPTRPAVYTRVSNYETWIQANTKDALYCEN